MTIQEIVDKLEQIEGVMDTDFLNRHAIEGMAEDITSLMWDINTKGVE